MSNETLLENLAKRRLILINANMSETSEIKNQEEIIDNFDWQLRRIRKYLNI